MFAWVCDSSALRPARKAIGLRVECRSCWLRSSHYHKIKMRWVVSHSTSTGFMLYQHLLCWLMLTINFYQLVALNYLLLLNLTKYCFFLSTRSPSFQKVAVYWVSWFSASSFESLLLRVEVWFESEFDEPLGNFYLGTTSATTEGLSAL